MRLKVQLVSWPPPPHTHRREGSEGAAEENGGPKTSPSPPAMDSSGFLHPGPPAAVPSKGSPAPTLRFVRRKGTCQRKGSAVWWRHVFFSSVTQRALSPAKCALIYFPW